MRQRLRRTSAGVPGNTVARLGSMVVLLMVIGMMYNRARDPQTWRWLADDREAEVNAAPDRVANGGPPLAKEDEPEEVVIPGPTDEDPAEWDDVQRLFDALSDKMPLAVVEMPAYWRLMRWARAQSFDELERRADRKVHYRDLWEQPEKYRGKPIRLRLHIIRVTKHEAAENSADVKDVYEAWGWTDESKSYPYVVVFSELPPGMKIGDDVRDEGVFVGYFLKVMSYPDALDKLRASPLLMGRMHRAAPGGARPVVGRGDWLWIWGGGGVIILAAAVGIWLRFSRVRMPTISPEATTDEEDLENWMRGGTPQPPASPRPLETEKATE